jgi:hypothetical protein
VPIADLVPRRLQAVEQQVKLLEDGQLKPWWRAMKRRPHTASSTPGCAGARRGRGRAGCLGAGDAPAGLGEAMRYGVLDGGKRLRPLLVLAACEAVARGRPAALRAAVAVELIHAYSLVHDDMPCMDNDVLRRGKPTVHVQFGEAQAMLAGDAMQALAFEVLTPDAPMRRSTWRPRCRRGCVAAGACGRPCRHGRWPGHRPGQRRPPLTKPRCATCTAARPAPCCRAAC